MTIRIVNTDAVASWMRQSLRSASFVLVLLFGGDRLLCCDEGVALEVDGEIVGMATIAPEGEERSGRPTIVGHYVMREHRRKGYGKAVMEAAVRRCIARGFTTIHIDAMSKAELRVIENLPPDVRAVLDVHDQSCGTESLD